MAFWQRSLKMVWGDRVQEVWSACGRSSDWLYLVACVMSNCLQPLRMVAQQSLCLWDSLDKNTDVGCNALLQGFSQLQGSNPGVTHCRRSLSHCGSPLIGWWWGNRVMSWEPQPPGSNQSGDYLPVIIPHLGGVIPVFAEQLKDRHR